MRIRERHTPSPLSNSITRSRDPSELGCFEGSGSKEAAVSRSCVKNDGHFAAGCPLGLKNELAPEVALVGLPGANPDVGSGIGAGVSNPMSGPNNDPKSSGATWPVEGAERGRTGCVEQGATLRGVPHLSCGDFVNSPRGATKDDVSFNWATGLAVYNDLTSVLSGLSKGADMPGSDRALQMGWVWSLRGFDVELCETPLVRSWGSPRAEGTKASSDVCIPNPRELNDFSPANGPRSGVFDATSFARVGVCRWTPGGAECAVELSWATPGGKEK